MHTSRALDRLACSVSPAASRLQRLASSVSPATLPATQSPAASRTRQWSHRQRSFARSVSPAHPYRPRHLARGRGLAEAPHAMPVDAPWVKWEIEQPRCAADVPRANQPSWEWPARCEPSVAAPPSAFQRALEYKESIACKPPAPPTSSLPLRMPLRYARLPEVGPLTHHVACRKIRRVMAGPHGAAAAQPCRSQTRDTPPETPFATSS